MSDAAVESAGPGPQALACANCQAELGGPYCAACGQKVKALNPSFHDLAHDVVHELLHVDGKIFQSVRLLVTRPGFLTHEWFLGRRARYISPIRLYLIFSVAFFAAAAIAPTTSVSVRIEVDPASLENAPDSLRRLSALSEPEIQRRITQAWAVWMPRAMFVLVPLFALLVSWTTRGSGRNYPQHLYFALHVHAAIFAAAAVAELLDVPLNERADVFVDLPLYAFVLWYVVTAFRTAYGGTVGRAIRRAAVVGGVYLIVAGVTIGAVVVVSLGA
jgi:hypothetical protein